MSSAPQARCVTILCCLAYFASYVTRLGFAAGLVEISAALRIASAQAGLACTALFISYGAGQFLSGRLGDLMPPRLLICAGLIGSSLCNLLLPACSTPVALIAVWCVNGLFQAMLWPPMVRVMAEALTGAEYLRASKLVSIAANVGTIAVYALMSLFVRFAAWTGYFLFAGAFGVCVAAVFFLGMRPVRPIAAHETVPRHTEASAGTRERLVPLIMRSGLPLIMLAIVLQGMLRDGVTTWMPSLIADTTGLGSSTAILSVVVLPIFSVLCIDLAAALQKRMPNDTRSSLLLFAVAAACAGATLPLLGRFPLGVIVLTAVLCGCMHAVNFLLICHVPSYFAGYGVVSSVSGIINSCTYIGSAASTWGIALLSERLGWPFTVGVWAGIAAAGALVCLLASRRWARFAGLER